MSFINTLGNTKITTGLIGAGLGVAVIDGTSTISAVSIGSHAATDPRYADESTSDTIGRVGGATIGAGIYGSVAGTGIAGLGYLGYKKLPAFANTPVSNLVPKGIKSVLAENPKVNSSLLMRAASNTKFASLGGLGIGATIGASMNKEAPGKGAAIGGTIGAGVGIAGSIVAKSMKAMKGTGVFGQTAAVLLATAGVGAGAKVLTGSHEYAAEDRSVSDGYGGYDNVPASSVKDRLNTINASGDMVFGLHRKRRG